MDLRGVGLSVLVAVAPPARTPVAPVPRIQYLIHIDSTRLDVVDVAMGIGQA